MPRVRNATTQQHKPAPRERRVTERYGALRSVTERYGAFRSVTERFGQKSNPRRAFPLHACVATSPNSETTNSDYKLVVGTSVERQGRCLGHVRLLPAGRARSGLSSDTLRGALLEIQAFICIFTNIRLPCTGSLRTVKILYVCMHAKDGGRKAVTAQTVRDGAGWCGAVRDGAGRCGTVRRRCGNWVAAHCAAACALRVVRASALEWRRYLRVGQSTYRPSRPEQHNR